MKCIASWRVIYYDCICKISTHKRHILDEDTLEKGTVLSK